MTICFFTSQHVSELRGGIERVTSILAKEFKTKGYNVFMLSSLAPVVGDLLLENQFILPNDTINSKENQCFLATFVVNRKIDIIINQSEVKANLELIKASVSSIPVISVIHSDPSAAIKAVQDNWDYWKIQYGTLKFSLLSPYFYIRKLYQKYTRKKYIKAKHLYYYNQSNAVVLLSEKFINSFINLTEIKDISKLYAISNPQTITRIQNIETKKENIVLFVGRLVYQKRLDRLFRIWKKIKDKKDWKLIIIGDGPDRDLYESLCKKWHIEKVEFVGQCDPTHYYKKAKVLCMTSSFEGSPCVIQEAIQHNVIPIAYRSYESIEDIIHNGIDGFTIKPFSASDYSNTLKLLISDNGYRESIINNIKQKRLNNKYSIDKIIGQWEELFKKLTINNHMRILWLSVTPSLFNPHSNGHNGGGWIASLEQIVRKNKDIELGVAFNFPDNGFKYENNGVSYYPIMTEERSLIGKMFGKSDDGNKTAKYLQVIEDFKPDLIQIFGSENEFGAICKLTKIPVVIHMQGCIPPYHNALFPIGMKKSDFLLKKGLSLSYRIIGLRSEKAFRKRAEMEIETIQSCKYFMGRTEWDKSLIDLFNPNATYFHCEEALRDSFINSNKQWKYSDGKKKTIISVISRPWYKGCDLILKTAALLKRFTDLDFEWRVYGIPEMKFYESVYGIKAKDVNVHPMGTASKEELVDALCSASCYVHTSYIDNSPNSICEAQILGVPVIATNVGGISTIVDDNKDGILFPANAPYTAASLIKKITKNRTIAEGLSSNAIAKAIARHDPDKIGERLAYIYNSIIQENKKQ